MPLQSTNGSKRCSHFCGLLALKTPRRIVVATQRIVRPAVPRHLTHPSNIFHGALEWSEQYLVSQIPLNAHFLARNFWPAPVRVIEESEHGCRRRVYSTFCLHFPWRHANRHANHSKWLFARTLLLLLCLDHGLSQVARPLLARIHFDRNRNRQKLRRSKDGLTGASTHLPQRGRLDLGRGYRYPGGSAIKQ